MEEEKCRWRGLACPFLILNFAFYIFNFSFILLLYKNRQRLDIKVTYT